MGNCIFRRISRFVYGTEDLYLRVRREIYNEALVRSNQYPDITLDSENGHIHIHEYINHMNDNGFFGGELEINIARSFSSRWKYNRF